MERCAGGGYWSKLFPEEGVSKGPQKAMEDYIDDKEIGITIVSSGDEDDYTSR